MTIKVSDLLDINHIGCNISSPSKKRVLEQLSQMMAANQPQFTPNDAFDSLLARERLGSTGLGRGVAIPHGRLKGSSRIQAALVKLKEAIDYDAVDGQPVDLLFALLVPEESTEEHLQLLAQLAEMFSDAELVKRLRAAGDSRALLDTLTSWTTHH